jgi:RimJ/RimL family protein N-acetyltransferase
MTKLFLPPIEKGRIRLRLLERSDLPMTLKWRNQDHIRKWFIHSEIISPEQHQEWFKQYLERDNDYVFIIEETQNFHKPVGQISLYNIALDKKKGELGRFMIGDAETPGKGLAKQATRLLLEVAFNRFRLKEVYLRVLRHNPPAISVYQQCGFQSGPEHDNLLIMNIFNPNPRRKA